MCGRFSLIDPLRLPRAFPQYRFPEFSETRLPRFNIAPTQRVLGVRNDGKRVAELLKWGITQRINVRAESLAARRSPLRRRCVQFADGFYEWHAKQPVYYSLRSGAPFVFAGTWEPEGGGASCDIVTCAPNELVAEVHNRMPVILPSAALDVWLDPEPLPPEVMASLLKPYDAKLMTSREVSRRVNRATYDAPDVLDADPVLNLQRERNA